jgi:hypothetical protein|tara:strand:+ start:2459 stop:3094 length:636 start_codon:yes stop_codon:yes gene_type:complete
MAFKRRGTGRDEMLKRNMERLAQRRRARATKPEPKKEDLKVGTKEPANPMVGMGPYKDGSVYASALAKAKAKLASSGNNIKPQTNPVTKEELQTPETQNQNVPPPAETREEAGEQTTRQFADLRGNTPENPNTEKDKSYRSPGAGTQPNTTPVSINESKPLSTQELGNIKNSLKGLFTSIQEQMAGKVYAGKNYGFVSQARYKKLKAAGKI